MIFFFIVWRPEVYSVLLQHSWKSLHKKIPKEAKRSISVFFENIANKIMTDWFDKTSIIELTGADFENQEPWKLKNKRCAFVLFYADWCGHCQNLKPDYAKFSDIAQFIKVYSVNTEKQKSLIQEINNSNAPYKIKSFPTILIYNNGDPIEEYKEKRSAEDLLKKAMNICNTKCRCSEI